MAKLTDEDVERHRGGEKTEIEEVSFQKYLISGVLKAGWKIPKVSIIHIQQEEYLPML